MTNWTEFLRGHNGGIERQMSGDVFPSFSGFNVGNSHLMDPVFFSDNSLVSSVIPNCLYIRFSKTRAANLFANTIATFHESAPSFCRRRSPPSIFVRLILLVCPPPQMGGVHTTTVVARVKSAGSVWSIATVKPERNVGRKRRADAMRRKIYDAVSTTVLGGVPIPAFFLAPYIDLSPKSGLQFIAQKCQALISHIADSLRSWSGPRGVGSTVAARLFSSRIPACSQAKGER